MENLKIPARIERWRRAWQSGDSREVAALYAADGEHESAKVAIAMPTLGRSALRGPAEIEAYARSAFTRVHPLRFDIVAVTETGETSVVEYWRHAPNAAPMRVCEVLQWRDELLTSVRVYHF